MGKLSQIPETHFCIKKSPLNREMVEPKLSIVYEDFQAFSICIFITKPIFQWLIELRRFKGNPFGQITFITIVYRWLQNGYVRMSQLIW